MNQLLKNFAIIGLSLTLVNCNSSEEEKNISSKDLLSFYSDSLSNPEANYILSKKEINDIVDGKNEDYFVVDVRSAHNYIDFHLENSINVPFTKSFLSEKNVSKIKSIKNKIIVVGENSEQAVNASLFLKQLGVDDFRVALGGMDFIKKVKENKINLVAVNYNEETPKYNYSKIMSESSSSNEATTEVKKVVKKPMVKRKKKAVSGGCG